MGMHDCVSGLSGFFLFVASTIYLLLGGGIMVASGAVFFTSAKDIIPPLYAGAAMTIGVLIFVVSIFGYVCSCAKKKQKCLLATFMVMTVILIAICLGLTIAVYVFEDMLMTAGSIGADAPDKGSQMTQQLIGNPTLQQGAKEAMKSVKQVAEMILMSCGMSTIRYQKTGSGELIYSFFCATGGSIYDVLETVIEQQCFGKKDPFNPMVPVGGVDSTPDSAWRVCVDNPDWAINDPLSSNPFGIAPSSGVPSSGVPSGLGGLGALSGLLGAVSGLIGSLNLTPSQPMSDADTDKYMSTPKGVFCQCSYSLVNFVIPYLATAKYIGIACICFFGVVFIASCWFCCCYKPKESDPKFDDIQQKGAQVVVQP